MPTAVANTTNQQQVLKSFQLANSTISQKLDPEYGKKLAKYINSTIQGGTQTGYYFLRNQRFRINREWASGTRNIQMLFADRLEFNGKQNYINLSWSCIKLANRIVTGLVGRWMNYNEKIYVEAKDPLSLEDKKKQYQELEYLMMDRKRQEMLQEQSGVQMIPQDQFIPADKEELNLFVTHFQRLPEEICYELGCNDVLEANGFFDSNKDKALHDSAEVGFVGTYTEMDEEGVVRVERVEPENAIYSESKYDDFRDTTWRGRIKSMKISELRRKYGTDFGGKLDEKQLFEIANSAVEYNRYDKITWLDEFYSTFTRPYDEWNIDVIEFELRSLDSEPFTVVTTKKNKSTLVKNGRPDKPSDNEEVNLDTKWNIYRGVFARNNDIMLEWALKTNMIRPQDPKEIGNCEFSYSFYMPQNYKMRNLAIPEKIEEPLEQMILTRIKMEQLVAKMIPVGAAIDVNALQELDLGLAQSLSPLEIQKLWEQTGKLYYRGKDAEGQPIPVPITELANAGFLNQMSGLIQMYQFHYSVLKDELGEDPAMMSQALQPRVTEGNVETAQQIAQNATDHYYNAYKHCMEDTAKKISCLLKDSVTYGSSAYRTLLSQEDVAGREFSTEIKMLPNAQDLVKFENFMNAAIASNPDFILFIDPFQLMRVAKEDVKLAESIFRQAQRKMLIWQQQTSQQNQQQTINGQIASAKSAEEEKRKSLKEELETKGKIDAWAMKGQKELAVLNGIFMLAKELYSPQKPNADGSVAKPSELPEELKQLFALSIKNIAIPLAMDNQEMTSGQMPMSVEQNEQQEEMEEAQEQQQQQQQSNNQQQPELAA